MRNTLLNPRVSTLLLNANRAFPSQCKNAKEMINEWRRTQRCQLVVPADPDLADVPAGSLPDGRLPDEVGR